MQEVLKLDFLTFSKLELKWGSQRHISPLVVGKQIGEGSGLWDTWLPLSAQTVSEQPRAGAKGSLKPCIPVWISSGTPAGKRMGLALSLVKGMGLQLSYSQLETALPS